MKPFKDWVLGTDFVMPLRHGVITDTFRMPSRIHHMGTDFCGKAGDEVLNMFPSLVTSLYASGDPGGWTVEVMNAQENTVAAYSHLENIKVQRGDAVSMGQVIGVLANVGLPIPRPHVHLQLRAWVDLETILKLPKKW